MICIRLSRNANKPASVQGFDISAGQIVFCNSRILPVAHLRLSSCARCGCQRCLLVFASGNGNSIFPVDSPRAQQRRVQTLDSIGCHDDFHVASIVETVQLIQQLQHGPLNLLLAAAFAIVPLDPTASISSKNTIDGDMSSATRNNSLTNFGPSPKYF